MLVNNHHTEITSFIYRDEYAGGLVFVDVREPHNAIEECFGDSYGIHVLSGTQGGLWMLYTWASLVRVNYYVKPHNMSLHDLETGACTCQAPSDGSTTEGNCIQCGHPAHLTRKYCGALR